MNVKNFYRFNITHEQTVFDEMKDYYYGITLSAHLVSFYEKFFSTFLRKVNKPFFIDTVSYVFARDIDNLKKVNSDGELTLKKSYQKLIDYCNGNIKTILEQRGFIPKDFLENNENLITEFSEKMINFQKEFFEKKFDKSIKKYSQILGKDISDLKPLFLTSPYFYFESIGDPWYSISLKTATNSIKYKDKYELYAVLCFSKEILLQRDQIEKIIDDYSSFDGFIFWISDFNEKNESAEYLRNLLYFIQVLSELGKPIINLYGEYFSLISSKFGLTGYSRGLGFSENKSVDASVTGGGLPKRYYFSNLHISLSETIIRQFFSDYPNLLCNCDTCSLIRNNLGVRDQPSLNNIHEFFNEFNFIFDSKKHLMNSHFSEIENISSIKIDDIILQLRNEIEFSQINRLDLYNIKHSHIRNWINCLTNVSD